MQAGDIAKVDRILRAEFERHPAPIVDLMQAQGADPFRILVATLLSARTQDATTAQVVRRLFTQVTHPSDLRRLSLAEIESLIYPVGFFHTKARHLKQLPDVLDARFGGNIPDTIEALCELPGVGRKTANLVVIHAFDRPGMCVDVHVHRISNRFGLIQTRTPFDSEMALRALLPRRYWKTWNRYLVALGQTRCRPIGPRCGDCPLAAWCQRVGVQKRGASKPAGLRSPPQTVGSAPRASESASASPCHGTRVGPRNISASSKAPR